MILTVKVTPNASKNQIVGWEGEILRLRVKGVPEKEAVKKWELQPILMKFFCNFFELIRRQLE